MTIYNIDKVWSLKNGDSDVYCIEFAKESDRILREMTPEGADNLKLAIKEKRAKVVRDNGRYGVVIVE